MLLFQAVRINTKTNRDLTCARIPPLGTSFPTLVVTPVTRLSAFGTGYLVLLRVGTYQRQHAIFKSIGYLTRGQPPRSQRSFSGEEKGRWERGWVLALFVCVLVVTVVVFWDFGTCCLSSLQVRIVSLCYFRLLWLARSFLSAFRFFKHFSTT